MTVIDVRGLFSDRKLQVAVDQGLSSLSNFILQVAIARSAGITSLATFAVVYSIYWLTLGATRALILEPLLVQGSRMPELKDKHSAGASATAALIGALLLPVILVVAQTLEGSFRHQLSVMAVALPVLLYFDARRYASFKDASAVSAVKLDASWVIIQVALFGALILAHLPVHWYLIAWGLGAALALLVHPHEIREGIRGMAYISLCRKNLLPLGKYGLGEFSLISGVQQFLPLALLLAAGPGVSAGLRLAQTMVSPANVMSAAANVVFLPRMAAAAHRRSSQILASEVRHQALLLSCIGTLMAITYGSVPDHWLSAIFGKNVEQYRNVSVAVALQFCLVGCGNSLLNGVRALKQYRLVLRVAISASPIYFAGPLILGTRYGVTGAAVGLIVGSLVTVALALVALRCATRRELT